MSLNSIIEQQQEEELGDRGEIEDSGGGVTPREEGLGNDIGDSEAGGDADGSDVEEDIEEEADGIMDSFNHCYNKGGPKGAEALIDELAEVTHDDELLAFQVDEVDIIHNQPAHGHGTRAAVRLQLQAQSTNSTG
jgi:hypothetical protein